LEATAEGNLKRATGKFKPKQVGRSLGTTRRQAMCKEESIHLVTTYTHMGQKLNLLEMIVKCITGTMDQTSVPRTVYSLKAGRFYKHRFIVPSVKIKHSGILGLNVLQFTSPNRSGRQLYIWPQSLPICKGQVVKILFTSVRKTITAARNNRPGQCVHTEL
jgi:hypothetical protein